MCDYIYHPMKKGIMIVIIDESNVQVIIYI